MQTFTPQPDRLLVGEAGDSDSSTGGVIIPGKVGIGQHVYKCVVEAISPAESRFKVGDVVILPLCGYELFLNGKGMRVVPVADVLGLLEESKILIS
jgi:co-chaperonin GroES (HSP10)